jgi:DNA polymerase
MSANPPLNDAEMLAALDWYRQVGVDIAVGEEPVDRFALSRMAPRPRSAEAVLPTAAAPAAPPPAAPPAAATGGDPAEARALAASAATLDELQALLGAYDGCGLKARATQLVFADGNPEAEIMLVGEGPGGEEDRVGKPFVGRAGQLLDRMLNAIGLDRRSVYIANTVPWRPPGNRNPTPEEIALCLPFLIRQVELVAPRLLVTLGNVPTQTLFDTRIGITRTRGQWRDLAVGSLGVKAIATLHPAYLLRQPLQKHQAWRDMLAIKAMMAELGISVRSAV